MEVLLLLHIKLISFNNKKSKLLICGLLILTLGCAAVYRSVTPDLMVLSHTMANQIIVIDAGHGGKDPGAISISGVAEKEINLAIAMKLDEYLRQAGAIVVNLRRDDSDLAGEDFTGTIRERKRKDLEQRAILANKNKADMFISIHVNADPSPQWFGAQTFYKYNNPASKVIGESIQSELKRILKNTKREAKEGNYYLMDKTNMPTVIVEVGFLSNLKEEKLLLQDEYQAKIAYAILSGILKSCPENI